MNEQKLGNDRMFHLSWIPKGMLTKLTASWNDHARDLLHLINTFRSEMPMPLVGIGHSLGGNMLCNLAFMHPRLLTTVVLLDPVIQEQASVVSGPGPAQASAFRRDIWPSRAEAEGMSTPKFLCNHSNNDLASFRKGKFYSTWNPRVLDRWCQFGIRSTPTALHPETDGQVTLSTTNHQECLTFLRATWDAFSPDGKELLHPHLVPDMHPENYNKYPFYRPEPPNTLRRLPELRPSALYIFGGDSYMSNPEARAQKMAITGVGLGGSGGAAKGRVEEVTLEGIGHLVAMEASERCADAAAEWIGREMVRFEAEMGEYKEWTKKSLAEKSTLSEKWKEMVGGPLKPRSKM